MTNLRVRFLQILVWSTFFMGPLCLGNQGTTEGILSAKGDSWIELLDNGDFLHRFIPRWDGEGPANGGAFDQRMIRVISELVVGNRVRVNWVHDGHLRVLKAEVVTPKEGGGIFIGYLLKTGKRWVDVQNVQEGKPWRFYLPWVGGYPSEGGGYDRKILKQLQNRDPSDPVRFSWEYKTRPTIVSVYEKVSDVITPFWVGKKLPEPKEIRVIGKPEKPKIEQTSEGNVSPFDMLQPKPASPFDMLTPKPASPFDMIKTQAGNPFEQAEDIGAEENPFEKLPESSPPTNPFDLARPQDVEMKGPVVNPFENMPLPQQSPFELMNKQ